MFAKMKTGTKVLCGFGMAIMVGGRVGLVGYRGITKLGGHVEDIGRNRLPSVRRPGRNGQWAPPGQLRPARVDQYADHGQGPR